MDADERPALPFDPSCPNCVKGNVCHGQHWASEEAQAEFARKVEEAFAENSHYKVLDLTEKDPDTVDRR